MTRDQVSVRLAVTGAQETRRAFEQVGTTGEGQLERIGRAAQRSTRAQRAFGATVQNVGFQVGDFATQIASGQNAVVAFTQQGTQLVSAFGPVGAAIGAAGAVVGALAVVFLNAAEAGQTLEERIDDASSATENYRAAAIIGGEGIANLIERYGALDKQLLKNIRAQLELNRVTAQAGLSKTFTDLQDEVNPEAIRGAIALGLGDGREELVRDTIGLTQEGAAQLGEALGALEGAKSFNQQADAVKNLSEVLADNLSLTEKTDQQLLDLAKNANNAALAVREFEQGQKSQAETLATLSKPIPELKRLADEATAPRKGKGGRKGRRPDNDAFPDALASADQSNKDLERQIELVGASEAAQEAFAASLAARRTEEQLLAALERSQLQLTPERRKQIEELAEANRTLTIELSRQSREQKELEKAQRKTAREAERAEKEQERFTLALVRSAASARSLEDALRRVVVQLAEAALQATLLGEGPLAGSGSGGSGGGFLGSIFGQIASAAVSAFAPSAAFPTTLKGTIPQGASIGFSAADALVLNAKGNAFMAGSQITPFAKGGIIDSPMLFGMSGNRMGLAGEAGDEVIAPLRRDRQGRMGVGAVPPKVNVVVVRSDSEAADWLANAPEAEQSLIVPLNRLGVRTGG